jgi:hypothetical protein
MNFRLTESDWTEPLNDFICGLAGLPSCYNKRATYFVNCTCLYELRQFARAKQYLFRIGYMPKRDQDSVFKELVNGRHYRVRGYNLRMGAEKKEGFSFFVCRNLPSNFTKRNLYEQYFYGQGWEPKADNKDRYPKLQDFRKCKKDDMLWEDGMDTEEIVSWWSLRHIWREYLPKIRIRAPCNDTCGECTILRNAF